MRARILAIAALICLCSAATALAESKLMYTIGPEDVLGISVWKDEALTREVIVRPDGKISFPLIGDVVANGRTVESVRAEIQTRINEFVPESPVSVMALQIKSPKVYIVGKVGRPGMYVMFERMTVMQALALAGGFTPFSSTGDILILRDVGGKQQTLNFDYDAVAKGKRLEQNILLDRGDTIVVP
ncbi:MAG: polysaccharide export protein [Proteobacteria bacterium]|nr:polysaccharide export protein [Pseudomonadota bacterium]MBU1595315.1 polysaccharide export protein [Pseudomonadota bacterium]